MKTPFSATCEKCGMTYFFCDGLHICPGGYCDMATSEKYIYRCPGCSGEFHEPARDGSGTTSHGNPRCPFCAYPMEGLK